MTADCNRPFSALFCLLNFSNGFSSKVNLRVHVKTAGPMWIITENETLHGTLILLFSILRADLFAVPFIVTFRYRPLMLCALRQVSHRNYIGNYASKLQICFIKTLPGSSWRQRGWMANAHVCVQPFNFLSYDSISVSMLLRDEQTHCGTSSSGSL